MDFATVLCFCDVFARIILYFGSHALRPSAVCRYPVTLADFFLADVTDSMLDGYVAGFPNTYASKVGKVRLRFMSVTHWSRTFLYPIEQTDDVMYKGVSL